ncbi:hypothetical protein DYB38_012555 [Aphanomyces astaci]|uniref:Tyrosine-protein kinase ephrin type A/B receptor-like domain-containing protein n=1 Tax=Aphanomyces astaci TaxID=112090 RepID=A0A397CDG4_APHAT|nr:hypothetical protein DYB38_012555 [Aphanomyces astaci]
MEMCAPANCDDGWEATVTLSDDVIIPELCVFRLARPTAATARSVPKARTASTTAAAPPRVRVTPLVRRVPWTPLPTATRVPRGTCLQADRPRASPRLALVDRRGKVIWTGVRCVPQIACPPGEYATESSAECSTCPPGTYSVRTSISIPIVHYYANQDGDSICKPTACAPGSGAAVGATHPTSNCQVCGRGEFSLGDDQPCAPTACPVGVEGSDLEKGNCLPCAEGYFSAGGADQCKQARCAFFPLGAKDSLTSCQAPIVMAQPRGRVPIPLAPQGSAAPIGSTDPLADCVTCGAGSFSPGGTIPCAPTQCVAGSAAPAQATSATANCSQCAAGTFSEGGTESCDRQTSCPQGFSSPAGASSAQGQCALYAICKPMACPLGTASNAVAATSPTDTCVLCPAGYSLQIPLKVRANTWLLGRFLLAGSTDADLRTAQRELPPLRYFIPKSFHLA